LSGEVRPLCRVVGEVDRSLVGPVGLVVASAALEEVRPRGPGWLKASSTLAQVIQEGEAGCRFAEAIEDGGGLPVPAEIPTLLRDQKLTIVCDHTRRNLTSAPTTHGSASVVG
jgi:hypothetical protein